MQKGETVTTLNAHLRFESADQVGIHAERSKSTLCHVAIGSYNSYAGVEH